MLATNQFDNDRARSEIVKFLVRAELPFSFVNTHDFSGMIQREILHLSLKSFQT